MARFTKSQMQMAANMPTLFAEKLKAPREIARKGAPANLPALCGTGDIVLWADSGRTKLVAVFDAGRSAPKPKQTVYTMLDCVPRRIQWLEQEKTAKPSICQILHDQRKADQAQAEENEEMRQRGVPLALVEVSGGVAEVTLTRAGFGKPNVQILDWDNVKGGDTFEPGDEFMAWIRANAPETAADIDRYNGINTAWNKSVAESESGCYQSYHENSAEDTVWFHAPSAKAAEIFHKQVLNREGIPLYHINPISYKTFGDGLDCKIDESGKITATPTPRYTIPGIGRVTVRGGGR